MKKGFTLIELLGVIIILTIITLIVFPNVIAYMYRYKHTSEMNTGVDLIISAAKLYVSDNLSETGSQDGFEYCVSLSKLVDEGYLKSPVKYTTVDDATSAYSVLVNYHNKYMYEVVSNVRRLYDSSLIVQDQSNSPNASFLGTPILKNQIEEVYTVEGYTKEELDEEFDEEFEGNLIATYDVSALKNNSIFMYVLDEDNDGLYEVYLCKEERIRANLNSRNLFSNMPNLDFVDVYFNITDDTDMSHMFENDVGLTGVNMILDGKVKDLSYMFNGCSNLEAVDFNWSFANGGCSLLRNVSHMFYGATNLEIIRMRYINFSYITNADDMFTGVSDTVNISIPSVSETFIRNALSNANISNYSLTLN